MAEKLLKNQEIVFPEESHLVIEEILNKYKLARDPEKIMGEMAEEIKKAQTFKERQEIAEKQPENKLARIIKEVAEGKISSEDFPRQLQQIFNISSGNAKELAKDLEKNVLVFAKRVFIERKVVPPVERPLIKPLPVAPPPEEPLEVAPPPKVTPRVERPEISPEEKKPKKPDVYREPIE